MEVVAELKHETLEARTKLDTTACPETGMPVHVISQHSPPRARV